jgi:hypothetical protein
MSKEISLAELAAEEVELLPRREALGVLFSPNFNNVSATASALALNAVTIASAANASAHNTVLVLNG